MAKVGHDVCERCCPDISLGKKCHDGQIFPKRSHLAGLLAEPNPKGIEMN